MNYEGPSLMISLDSNLTVVLPGSASMKIRSLFPDHVKLCCERSGRGAKKALRSETVAMLLLVVSNDAELQQALVLCRYVRSGLADPMMKIVLLGAEGFLLDEVAWLEEEGATCCLIQSEKRHSINRSVIRRELDAFACLLEERRQRSVETQLLMSVTRFSRVQESIDSLTQSFAEALSAFCFSSLTLQARPPQENKPAALNVCYPQPDSDPVKALTDPLAGLVELAFSQKAPQVQLLPQELDISNIEDQLGEQIGGYLAFPLVVYERVVRVLVCLIPAQAMDRVSMHQVEVMTRAAEQLQVLLERRSAENQLKNQYLRLKRAMIELNETREQLQHTEKMASIGQLAAGIAHEINNPLAYVLGNFRPLDEYVDTMVKMLELHGEFMQAIDLDGEGRGQQLRSAITEFQQKSDLAYIYDDIRSIVNESRDGLMRVKDIISDLNSFSRKDNLEVAPFALDEVVDQTLRILNYELGKDMQLEVDVRSGLTVTGHRGFVQQVLTNLIKNAAQAMAQAEISEPQLVIRATPIKGQLVEVTVRDAGPGISPDNLKRIFEPFYTTKDVGKGTGLGLSVTWNLVQKMGGTLTVESEEGVYTQFALRLPLSLKLEAAQPA